MPRLKKLFLVRHEKDLKAIHALQDLVDLGLSGITFPDLTLLLPLMRLRKVSILLGATTNLAALAQLPELEGLFLMRITKFPTLKCSRS